MNIRSCLPVTWPVTCPTCHLSGCGDLSPVFYLSTSKIDDFSVPEACLSPVLPVCGDVSNLTTLSSGIQFGVSPARPPPTYLSATACSVLPVCGDVSDLTTEYSSASHLLGHYLLPTAYCLLLPTACLLPACLPACEKTFRLSFASSICEET